MEDPFTNYIMYDYSEDIELCRQSNNYDNPYHRMYESSKKLNKKEKLAIKEYVKSLEIK